MKKLLAAACLCLALLLAAAFSCADGADTGLPVVRLEIDGTEFERVVASPRHTYRAAGGTISVDVPEGYTGEFGGGPLRDLDGLALSYFRGRGNSTWLNRKKPFRFKLEKGADLLGMGSNKHWVLLANACDGSLLRARLASYAGRAFGLAYTPEMAPVEFYVNDTYMGSYVLSEQIRLGKNRVDAGDGGVLLSMSPYEDEPEENVIETALGVRFLSEDPDFTEVGGSAEEIAAFLQRVEDAVYGGSAGQDGLPCAELMDVRSAAKYWWIEEFVMNGDAAFTPSTYLYIKDGMLYWGPLWDFDLAPADDPDVAGFNHVHMPWLDYLRAYDPSWREILAEEWRLLEPILSEMAEDGGVIDRYAESLRASWERNEAAGLGSEAMQQGSLDEQVSALKGWYRSRIAWIAGNLDSLGEIPVALYFYVDGEYLTTSKFPLNPGIAEADVFPEDPVREGFVFAGWEDGRGSPVAPGDRILDNTPVYAVFVPENP